MEGKGRKEEQVLGQLTSSVESPNLKNCNRLPFFVSHTLEGTKPMRMHIVLMSSPDHKVHHLPSLYGSHRELHYCFTFITAPVLQTTRGPIAQARAWCGAILFPRDNGSVLLLNVALINLYHSNKTRFKG